VCCVCGENKKEVRSIESENGKERKLSQLLLKYGDLNLVQGIFTENLKKKEKMKEKMAIK
jgi:low temperature requirement protein LtrA